MRTARLTAGLLVCVLLLLVLTGPLARAQRDAPDTPADSRGTVVISQVYGGGGNSGATYTHDFIELFNPGDAPVSLAGWSLQYASAGGTSWQMTPLTGTILPGRYFLVQQAEGRGGRVSLPTPDVIGTIPMSAQGGKVVLLGDDSLLPRGVSCPEGPEVVDVAGFNDADCFDGAGPGPKLDNRSAALRGDNGCHSTGDNSRDFAGGAPQPRNSDSPAHRCAPSLPPEPTPRPTAAERRPGLPVTGTVSAAEPVTGTLPVTATQPGPTYTFPLTAGVSVGAPLSLTQPVSRFQRVLISQVYGGGGNSGATYTHDFIELYNPGPDRLALAGWSVQYASASGATWLVTPLTGTIGPGGY